MLLQMAIFYPFIDFGKFHCPLSISTVYLLIPHHLKLIVDAQLGSFHVLAIINSAAYMLLFY